MNKEQLLARAQELQIQVPKNATNKEISDLIKIAEHPLISAELKTAQKDRDNAVAELEQANTTLEALNSKLAKVPQAEKFVTFQTEAGTFEFTVKKFRFKGEKYTAEEAVENTDLMETLIKVESNLLKQV